MKLLEIAQIYTDLVNADNGIPDSEYQAKDIISELRTKYHDILMDQMQIEGVEFIDRFDAARLAFDIVKNEGIHTR